MAAIQNEMADERRSGNSVETLIFTAHILNYIHIGSQIRELQHVKSQIHNILYKSHI